MSYIRTYSGKTFSTTPTPDEVDLDDIAVALSRAPRFGGHTHWPYSVAAHCIHVSWMVPKHLQPQALFHDASEAYIMDIPSPFKALMPDYKKIETGIMRAVGDKFGFTWPIEPIVHQADAAALYQERRALFTTPEGIDDLVIPPAKAPIKVGWNFRLWSQRTSEQVALEFLYRARQLLHPNI